MMKTKTKTFKTYLLVTFLLAWIMQMCAGWFSLHGQQMIYTAILAVSMFAPAVGVLAARVPLKEMGFMPKLKGNLKMILTAWFVPGIFAIIGAGIYFLLFPQALDLSLEQLRISAGPEALEQLASQGIAPMMYVLITILSASTIAPLINMFAAIGEEIGWRGYMYKALKQDYGRTKGRLLGGLIWGVWHWPIMFFGYEYGTAYFGYPILGPLAFCIIAAGLGFFLDALYEKSNCIWLPALGHGAINAATWAILITSPAYMDRMILGPVPVGLIAGLPYLVTALYLAKKN